MKSPLRQKASHLIDDRGTSPSNNSSLEIRLISYENGLYEGQVIRSPSKSFARVGFGAFLWDSGQLYIGKWVSDQMEEEGVLYLTDGRSVHGKFRKNKLQGVACLNDRRGNRLIGYFEDGVLRDSLGSSPLWYDSQSSKWFRYDIEKKEYKKEYEISSISSIPNHVLGLKETAKKMCLGSSGLKSLRVLEFSDSTWFLGLSIENGKMPSGIGALHDQQGRVLQLGQFQGKKLNGFGRQFLGFMINDGIFEKQQFRYGLQYFVKDKQFFFGDFEGNQVKKIIQQGSGYPSEILSEFKDFNKYSSSQIARSQKNNLLIETQSSIPDSYNSVQTSASPQRKIDFEHLQIEESLSSQTPKNRPVPNQYNHLFYSSSANAIATSDVHIKHQMNSHSKKPVQLDRIDQNEENEDRTQTTTKKGYISGFPKELQSTERKVTNFAITEHLSVEKRKNNFQNIQQIVEDEIDLPPLLPPRSKSASPEQQKSDGDDNPLILSEQLFQEHILPSSNKIYERQKQQNEIQLEQDGHDQMHFTEAEEKNHQINKIILKIPKEVDLQVYSLPASISSVSSSVKLETIPSAIKAGVINQSSNSKRNDLPKKQGEDLVSSFGSNHVFFKHNQMKDDLQNTLIKSNFEEQMNTFPKTNMKPTSGSFGNQENPSKEYPSNYETTEERYLTYQQNQESNNQFKYPSNLNNFKQEQQKSTQQPQPFKKAIFQKEQNNIVWNQNQASPNLKQKQGETPRFDDSDYYSQLPMEDLNFQIDFKITRPQSPNNSFKQPIEQQQVQRKYGFLKVPPNNQQQNLNLNHQQQSQGQSENPEHVISFDPHTWHSRSPSKSHYQSTSRMSIVNNNDNNNKNQSNQSEDREHNSMRSSMVGTNLKESKSISNREKQQTSIKEVEIQIPQQKSSIIEPNNKEKIEGIFQKQPVDKQELSPSRSTVGIDKNNFTNRNSQNGLNHEIPTEPTQPVQVSQFNRSKSPSQIGQMDLSTTYASVPLSKSKGNRMKIFSPIQKSAVKISTREPSKPFSPMQIQGLEATSNIEEKGIRKRRRLWDSRRSERLSNSLEQNEEKYISENQKSEEKINLEKGANNIINTSCQPVQSFKFVEPLPKPKLSNNLIQSLDELDIKTQIYSHKR